MERVKWINIESGQLRISVLEILRGGIISLAFPGDAYIRPFEMYDDDLATCLP